MSAFLRNVEEIFTAARCGGKLECDMSLLMNGEGGIHVVCGGGWELEPLRVHYGARTAYRVSRNAQGVRVEGRSAEGSCVLETPQAVSTRALPQDYPQYSLIA